ncbi:MAG: UDP-3-O-acyl-N-acetylglucosamine deacetylase [Alphaproteobacteria bacterium]
MAPGAINLKDARQHTLKSSIDCSGVGLHSGAKVTMILGPGEPDTGIVFRRTDVAGGGAEVTARWDSVVDTRLNTTIGNDDGIRIGTIEHLMAALSGAGVDNALIEINGPEVPIMDGSAEPFLFLIECAGLAEQPVARRLIEVLKPVSVGDEHHSAVLSPGKRFSVSFEIDYEGTFIHHQQFFANLANGTFQSEIARARTFGFEHEIAELRAAGLIRGGSLDNAIVVTGDGILNDDGLRFEDEFVRHKVLDTVGDLYLAGGSILGHFHGYRSGHALNHDLLKALIEDRSAWRYTEFGSPAPAFAAPGETQAIAATA